MKSYNQNFKNKQKAIRIKEVIALIEKAKNILLVTHKCPDPDAIGSVVSLAKALEQKNKNVFVSVEGTLNEQVRAILTHANYELKKTFDMNTIDVIIVLDTNSPLLFDFNTIKTSKAKKILIDHHSPKPDISRVFDVTLVDETAVSVTQMIYPLLKEMGVEITHEIALSLAAGIVTDSAYFVAATPKSFEILALILKEADISFQRVLDIITIPMDMSEKVARLKGSQRVKFWRKEGYIIATSKVSSFEGSVAKALIYLGADVSFVGAVKTGEVRISARAKGHIVDKGLHLGRDIMPKIAQLIGGDAGGHAAAAGANGIYDDKIDEALHICVDEVKRFIEGISP